MTSPDVAWAQTRQVTLPALSAREESALRRLADVQSLRAGRLGLTEAIPGLAGRRLDDPVVLAGLRADLDTRALARATARLEPVPELGSEARRKELSQARAATLSAEADADAAERELLLELEAWLGRYPGLGRPAVDARRARLQAVVDAARGLAVDDPARPAALVRAAAADAELARWSTFVAELQLALLQGREPARPALELQLLQEAAPGSPPPADDAVNEAAARLLAARGSWSSDSAAEVGQALQTWLDEVRLPRARAALADARSGASALGALSRAGTLQRIQEVEAALELAPNPPPAQTDPLAAGLTELAQLEREGLLVEQTNLGAHLVDLDSEEQAAAEQARRTQEAAVATRQLADEAKASAQGESETRVAEVLGSLATATERAAAAWTAAHSVEDDLNGRESARQASLDAVRTGVVRLETESPLTADLPDPDELFGQLRTLVLDLRQGVTTGMGNTRSAVEDRSGVETRLSQESLRLEAERQGLDSVEPAPLRQEHATHLDAWEAAIRDEREAHGATVQAYASSSEDMLRDLREVQQLRQRLKGRVSADASAADRAYLVQDLGQELSLMPARLQVRMADRISQLRALPSRLANWNLIKAFLWGSSGMVLAFFGWWAARRRTAVWTETLLKRIAGWRQGVRPEDLAGARAPTHRALETLLDLLVGWLLIGLVQDRVPELAVVLFVYLHVAAYRFVLALWELGFAKAPAVRPALRTLSEPSWMALRQTVRLFTLWWVVRALVLALLPDLLGLYSLAEVARFVFTLALVGILVRELSRWEPTLRGMASRRQLTSPLVRWLAEEPRPAMLAPIKGAAGLVFAGATIGAALVAQLSQEGSSLSRLFTHVGPLRLGRQAPDETVSPPLPEAVVRAVLETPVPPEAAADRKSLVAEVMAEWHTWHADQRRGLVMLVGDRGEGKGNVLDEVVTAIEAEGATILRTAIRTRLATSVAATDWLARLAGIGSSDAENPEELVESLRARPPTTFVIDEFHLAFVRAVDGFAGIQTLLYTMNATGDQHFWLVSTHSPAWHFLTQLGGLVNTGIFRATFEVPNFGESELRRLCLGKTRLADVEVDFSGLVRPNLLGDDPQVELERATSLFFRLLAEATNGNPSVALRFWLQCLRPGAGPEDPLQVWHAPCLMGGATEGLSNNDLFILAALRTQDRLDENELSDVTDIPLAAVRTVVRDLTGRGLVVPSRGGFEVDRGAQPAVTRALRRRNFIQWEA